MDSNPQLDLKKSLITSFEGIIHTHHLQVENQITDQNQNWSSNENKWSVAECLIHLNLSAQEWLPFIRQCIVKMSKTNIQIVEFKSGFLANKFINFLQPPPKIKVSTSKRFRPDNINQIKNINENFTLYQKEFIQLVQDCKTICLKQAKVSIPGMQSFKVSLGDAFKIVITHEKRHLWQIKNIIDHANFPKC